MAQTSLPPVLPSTLADSPPAPTSPPTLVSPSLGLALALPAPALPEPSGLVAVKVEKVEDPAAAVTSKEATVKLDEVLVLSDDESEDLVPLRAGKCVASPRDGPYTPHVAVVPNTSGDEEFARKLFVALNREAIGIPGDGALVDLVSDSEEEEGAGKGGSPPQESVLPKSPPSA